MPATMQTPTVRKGKQYTSEELHAACVKAVEKDGRSQVQLADLVGKSAGTISRALTDASGRYATTQVDILHALNGWDIERLPTFWARTA